MHCILAYSYNRTGQEGHNALLRSILLRVSSLSTGEDIQTNQVRDEYVLFVTETIRVSVYTSVLASVASRFNPKTAMIPVGAVHRRTRRMMCRLTGGRGVDMKDKSHNGCVPPSTQGALNKVSRLMMLMVVGASRDIMPKAAF